MDLAMEGTRNFPHNRSRMAGKPMSGLTAKHRQNYYSSMPSLAPGEQFSNHHSSPPIGFGSSFSQAPPPQGHKAIEHTFLPAGIRPSRSRPHTPNRYSYYPAPSVKMNPIWSGSANGVNGRIPWIQEPTSNLPYPEPGIPKQLTVRGPTTGNPYEYDDGENVIYEQIQNSDTPLTFTQAQNALNNMAPIGYQMTQGRMYSGAKSAETATDYNFNYDLQDNLLDEEERPGNFEQEFRTQIEHQNALLHVIQMEKLSLEGRMRHVLRQRQELQDRLQFYRQHIGQPIRNNSQGSAYQPRQLHSEQPSYLSAAQFYMSPGTTQNDTLMMPGQRQDQSPAWNGEDISYLPSSAGKLPKDAGSKSPKWNVARRGETSNKHPNRRYSHSPHTFKQIAIEYSDNRAKRMQQLSGDSSSSSDSEPNVEKRESFQGYSYPKQTAGPISPGLLSGTVQQETALKQRNYLQPPTSMLELKKENSTFYPASGGPPPSFVGSMCVPINASPQRRKSPKTRHSMIHIPYDEPQVTAAGMLSAENQSTTGNFWIRSLSPKPSYPASNGHDSQASMPKDPASTQVRRRNLDPKTRQLRLTNPKKLINTDFYEPGQESFVENCIPLKETPESMKYYRKQINILNQENHLPSQNETSKSVVKTRDVPERKDSASSPEPIDEEIAEICARDLSQPQPNTQRNNPANLSRRLERLPVHLEEDSDAEFDLTPVHDTQAPTEGRQSSIVIETRTPTNNDGFVHNIGETKIVRPEFGMFRQRAISSTPPTMRNLSELTIMGDSAEKGGGVGQNNHQPSDTTDSSLNSPRSPNKKKKSVFSSITTLNASRRTTTNAQLVPVEFDTVSSASETIRVGNEAIGKHESVKFMCLGPIDGFQLEPKSPGLWRNDEDDSPISPIWIAVCSGDLSVFVYDLKTHRELLTCREHEQYSRTPVVAILPLVVTSNINKSSPEKSLKNNQQAPSGLLCVVQVDGHITLYNIASRRVSGRLGANQQIAHAMLLPHTKIMHNCLAQNILLISQSGAISCCQWRFTIYTTDHTNVRHPHWQGELHDLGANVYHHLTEDKKILPYVCCICPHQMTSSNGVLAFDSGRSPTNTSTSSKRLQPTDFCLIAATLLKHEELQTVNLRVRSWEPRGQKMASCDKVTKLLNVDFDCELVGITYAEIAGAPSICICLTTQVYWFSLKSLDIVSTLKLPLCTQPVNLLAPVWPHTFSSCAVQLLQRERLWIASTTGRLLEISAFESQRRRDAHGRNCLVMLYAVPSDLKITAVTSTLNDKEIVLVGTDKGEIRLIQFPKNYQVCKMPNCPIGLPTPEDLVHHVVCDHYLVKPDCFDKSGFQCEWPECEFTLQTPDGPKTAENLVSHARGHVAKL